MRKTIKSQDALEVIYSKIDSLEKQLDRLPRELNKDLLKLSEHKPELNYSAFEKYFNQSLSTMNEKVSDLIINAENIQAVKAGNQALINNMNEVLDKVNKEDSNNKKTFYIITGASILIALLFVSLFTISSLKLKEVKSDYKILDERQHSWYNYLEDSGTMDDFSEWLGNNQ